MTSSILTRGGVQHGDPRMRMATLAISAPYGTLFKTAYCTVVGRTSAQKTASMRRGQHLRWAGDISRTVQSSESNGGAQFSFSANSMHQVYPMSYLTSMHDASRHEVSRMVASTGRKRVGGKR